MLQLLSWHSSKLSAGSLWHGWNGKLNSHVFKTCSIDLCRAWRGPFAQVLYGQGAPPTTIPQCHMSPLLRVSRFHSQSPLGPNAMGMHYPVWRSTDSVCCGPGPFIHRASPVPLNVHHSQGLYLGHTLSSQRVAQVLLLRTCTICRTFQPTLPQATWAQPVPFINRATLMSHPQVQSSPTAVVRHQLSMGLSGPDYDWWQL